ncbi:uncharacterized protein LOC136089886 [Hydra vulgaris]|uniref:Uncharacterized protein LOC136089886 n=1 Tax=Hydra vulgaris TaxID=6087 RepID=A0ABM4DCC9_HYDVU
MFKKIIARQLSTFCDLNKTIPPEQNRFREKSSSEYALINIVDVWMRSIDQDDLDNLPALEDDPDTIPHHHGEDDPGPIQLEEDDNGIYGPQPKDGQLCVPENNLVEENNTFPSTSQIEDPALWPKILINSFREILVQQGPRKLKEKDFPKDDHGQKFSVIFYKGHFPNGETYERKWLVYSKHSNSIFCFPCKIFSFGKMSKKLTEIGYSD